MNVGDKVHKIKGYGFTGWIVSAFTTLEGKERYVVEMEGSGGLLHIFAPEQLELGEPAHD